MEVHTATSLHPRLDEDNNSMRSLPSAPPPLYTTNQTFIKSPSYRISWARIWTVAFTACLAVLLPWLYATYTTVTYAYMGYEYHYRAFNWLIGLSLSLFVASVLPLKVDRPGTVFLWIMFVLAFVPTQMLSSVSLKMAEDQVLVLQMAVLLGFSALLLANATPPLQLRMGFGVWRQYAVYFGFISAGCYLLLIASFGLPSAVPSFTDVYDVRLEHREQLASGNPIISYVWSWAGKVVNPLIIAFGVINRKHVLVAAGVAGQLYLYALNGSKSALLSFLLIVTVVILVRLMSQRFALAVTGGAVLLIGLSKLLDYLLVTEWFTALFGQRLLIVPGILTGFYFEFFDSRPKGLWAYSFLGGLFDYPYDRDPSFLIGTYYYGNELQRANANLWADGFANAGVLGVLLVSALAGVVVWLFNSIARGRSLLVLSVLAGLAAFNLASASLFSSLLTHGIALSLGAALLMPYRSEEGSQAPTGTSDPNRSPIGGSGHAEGLTRL